MYDPDNVRLYHIDHIQYVPYYLRKKNRSTVAILFEPKPGSKKCTILYECCMKGEKIMLIFFFIFI